MRISRKVFYIRTKDSPIEFHAGNGTMSDLFEDVEIYPDEYMAKDELSKFDTDREYVIGVAGIVADI